MKVHFYVFPLFGCPWDVGCAMSMRYSPHLITDWLVLLHKYSTSAPLKMGLSFFGISLSYNFFLLQILAKLFCYVFSTLFEVRGSYWEYMFPNWARKKFFGPFLEKGHFGSLKIFLVQKDFLLILITLFEVQGSYWE